MCFTGLGAASGFQNPQVFYNTTTGQATFTVENDTGLVDPEIRISSPYTDWSSQNLTYSSNSTYSVNVSFDRPNGIYYYRYVSQNHGFPDNHFTFVAGTRNDSVLAKGLKFQNQNSSSSLCSPYGDFTCEYENYQSERMISAVQYYKATANQTYLDRALNFSSKPYGETFAYRCQTFNCGTKISDSGVPSSVRQGALIEGLWQVYSVSDNSSVRDLALGYSQGSPQESCNVWNSSYNCTTGWGQGRMAQGYLTAYRVTGNSTYLNKAEKLLELDYNHSLFGKALTEAYKITGEDSYRERARELAREVSCENCSDNFMKKEFYWSGFLSTEEYGYYRNGYQDMNSSCLQDVNSTCSNPLNQSRASKYLLKKYLAFQNNTKDVSNGGVLEKDRIGDPVAVTADFEGMVQNTSVQFRQVGGNWTNCDIGWFGDCFLTENNSLEQGVYEYRFKTQNLSFPQNGSLRFALNSRNDDLLEETEAFASSGMETLPEGEYCDLSDDPLACDNEGYQAKMLSGYTQIYSSSDSYQSRIYELFYGPYVDFIGASANCDPVDGDYDCGTGGYREEASEEAGSYKQGNLIESMWDLYSETGNGTVYVRAENYTRGSAEDCDVWAGDFSCDSSKGQAAMIGGYSEAYRITGNQTYRDIAVNLSEAGVQGSQNKVLAGALWEASVLYNNTNYSDQALNWTESLINSCTSGECTADEYTSSVAFAHDTFVYGNNDSYSDYYQGLVDNTTGSGQCGPWKEDYACSAPDTQGMFMETLQTAAYSVPMKLKTVDSFNVSSTSLQPQSSTDLVCSTRNVLQNTTLRNTTFSLDYPGSAFALSGNQTQDVGNIPYQNSSEASWSLTAEQSGTFTVSCVISSVNGLDQVEEVEIAVSEPEPEGGGGSGGQEEDSGGAIILPEPEPEPEYLNYSLEDFRNISDVSDYGLDAENYTYERASCGSATRTVWPSNSTLDVNYCGDLTPVVIDEQNSTLVELFNQSVSLQSNYSLNLSNYSAPALLERELKVLDVNSTVDSIDLSGNGSALVSSKLNRPVMCTVSRNGREVYSEFTSDLSYEVELEDGLNSISVDCGGEVENFNVEYDSEVPREDEGSSRFIVAALLSLVVATLFFRSPILFVKNSLLFRFYSRRFRQSIYHESPAKALEYYNEMKNYSNHVSEDLFYSEISLMRGVQLYLAMDLIKEGIEDDIVNAFGEDIEGIVNRFMERSDNDHLQKMLNSKLEEIKGSA
ncbi:putative conserved protein YyaL [Candidatus Nanohalovita haloferacivicina]|nr:putative conserved protein YyaL [Candidatus Nanohalobia archaeon BNXNv]